MGSHRGPQNTFLLKRQDRKSRILFFLPWVSARLFLTPSGSDPLGTVRGGQSLSRCVSPCCGQNHLCPLRPTLSLRAFFPPLFSPLPCPAPPQPPPESPLCHGWTAQSLCCHGLLCKHVLQSERALPTHPGNQAEAKSPQLGGGDSTAETWCQPQLCDLRQMAQPLWASVM